MDNVFLLSNSIGKVKVIFYDVAALTFIYLIPVISHLVSFPVYLIEPMRIIVILSLVHTNRKNTYLIAVTLPLFSFFVSAHPVFLKSLLIMIELVINVWLFYTILNITKKSYLAITLSIIISKIFYYLIKFAFIGLMLLNMDLISSPIYTQIILIVLMSFYVALLWKKTMP